MRMVFPKHFIKRVSIEQYLELNSLIDILKMWNRFRFGFFVSLTLTTGHATGDYNCTTPTREGGKCISVYQCEPILDIFRYHKGTISTGFRNLLREFRCDQSDSYLVCCPETFIPVARWSIDIKSHENINLLPKQCGKVLTTDRIFHGQKAKRLEFPWMALLDYDVREGFINFKCGGTIINKNYILTAAHCLSDKLIGVRVGEYDLSSDVDCEKINGKMKCSPPVQDLKIEKIIVHEGYNVSSKMNRQHDIALLRVKFMNTYEENVKPICLPIMDGKTFDKGVVTGWGRTENETISDVLMKVELPILRLDECQSTYARYMHNIGLSVLCAGILNNKDSCEGDSGGPLQVAHLDNGKVKYVQHGIVSFGPTECGSKIPGVYTNVNHYLKWILDNIKP